VAGFRPSDSGIVRAALRRMAQPGAELREAFRAASKLGGRIKKE
jgi:hypothetical protein